MYADDTVIYVSAATPCEAGAKLTPELEEVSQWLKRNHLTLNLKKTVAMHFSIRRRVNKDLKIIIDQEEIEEVSNFKFLGIILDSQLKFDTHVQKLSKTLKTNLNCFRMARQYIPLHAAQLFIHAMIFSHISYCITVWSQASQSTIKPIASLYKQALKIMDKKQMKWHHCIILRKYNMLSFDSFIQFSFIKLIFKCVNDVAPAVLCPQVKETGDNRPTRGSVNGNHRVAMRSASFGQSSYSVKGIHLWNALPTEIKKETDLKTFNKKVKLWLKSNQVCEH